MTLSKDLELFGEFSKNPYEKFNLLENPFPGYGDSRTDVCTDQIEIKRKFASVLSNFESETKRLRINGRSGAGKTNILRYLEYLTLEARTTGRISEIYPVYIAAPGDSYINIHKQIIEKISNLFLGDLLLKLKSNSELFNKLEENIKPSNELLSVLKSANRVVSTLLFDPDEEFRRNALINWLKGEKLSAQDKKTFFGSSSVPDIGGSSSLAIRLLDALLQVLKETNLCQGLVLLFDEFEEIFEGLTRSKQSKYAQDLRHLLDTLQESTFFVIATVPNPKDLAQYPAIERRLNMTLTLQPISDSTIAMQYVQDYMRAGRELYFKGLIKTGVGSRMPEQGVLEDLKPLKQEDIIQIYNEIKDAAQGLEVEILPGYFLPRMRLRMQEIVEG